MEGMKIKTSRLLLIVLIYYVITSFASLVLGQIQPILTIPDEVIQLTQFGPTLGVLTVMILFSGRQVLISCKFSFHSFILRRFLYVIVMTLIVFALAIICYQIYGIKADFTHPADLSHPFWIIIIAQFIGAAGEELGWRCFLQPILQTKLSVLRSSILVGLLWGIWHIGIFAEGLVFAVLFISSAVSISIILGELLRNARGHNLIIATAFHAFTNLGLLLLFNEESGNLFAMAAFAGACLVAALTILMINYSLAKSYSK